MTRPRATAASEYNQHSRSPSQSSHTSQFSRRKGKSITTFIQPPTLVYLIRIMVNAPSDSRFPLQIPRGGPFSPILDFTWYPRLTPLRNLQFQCFRKQHRTLPHVNVAHHNVLI